MEEGFERDLVAYQCAMVKRGFFLPDFYRPFFYGQPTEGGIVYPSLPNKDGDRLEWRAGLSLPINLTAYDFKHPIEKILPHARIDSYQLVLIECQGNKARRASVLFHPKDDTRAFIYGITDDPSYGHLQNLYRVRESDKPEPERRKDLIEAMVEAFATGIPDGTKPIQLLKKAG